MALAPDRTIVDLAGTYGLVVYGAGLALAWVFHRSRAFIALAALAVVDITVLGEPDRREILLAAGTVVLLLVAILGVVRDRGVASRVGSIQLLGASALGAASALVFVDPARIASLAAQPMLLPLEAVVWPGAIPGSR
jgi:hypothetical protein